MTNEEKILALLEAQGKMLQANGTLLFNLVEDVSGLKRDVAKIQLDIENHKDRVADLAEDVSVLKAAFRGLSREVSELKQAQ